MDGDTGFPALIAPASLKRRRPAAEGSLHRAGFPALIAPASLKLAHVLRLRLGDARFPALIAPASLKPDSAFPSVPLIGWVFRR